MSYPELNYRMSPKQRAMREHAKVDRQFWSDVQNRRLSEEQILRYLRQQPGGHWPPPDAGYPAPEHWSAVLGLPRTATSDQIKTAYRRLARTAHADAGGSDRAMTRLNVARDQAMKERKP